MIQIVLLPNLTLCEIIVILIGMLKFYLNGTFDKFSLRAPF